MIVTYMLLSIKVYRFAHTALAIGLTVGTAEGARMLFIQAQAVHVAGYCCRLMAQYHNLIAIEELPTG
jgi:hypothetical protein